MGEWAKAELPLDPARTHWLGILQDAEYQQVLACSTVHLYLTVPFVLSWSLLEAMAAGCALVASATAPVQEVLDDGISALLVDFFDPEAHATALNRLFPMIQACVQLSVQQPSKKRPTIHRLPACWLGECPWFGAQHLGAAWLLAILT